MVTSKEVFAKRKQGFLAEAYNMALELIKQPHNEWNIKAYAWCLIDMIKHEVGAGNLSDTQRYVSELKQLEINANDEVLTKSIKYVLSISNPQMQEVTEAKKLSKQGRHAEAANLLRVALQKFPEDVDIHTSLGWELHKIGKDLFSNENIQIYPAKKLLAEYMNLKNERPSLLHSLFLRYADKLVGSADFNIVAFIKLWDLNNLTEDDFTRYIADDGKAYPALAEKIIQHAAKDSFNKSIVADAEYILPFLDDAIERYPDNFWLTFNKAKLLLVIGQNDLAITIAITVVKNKINDFWAWDLLGDILLNIDKDKALSCYCKALLCRSDEKFIGKVRIKLAELLIEKKLYQEAKSEISTAVLVRKKEGWEITENLKLLQNCEWYNSVVENESNEPYYLRNTMLADALLFHDIPWSNAVVGESFSLPEKKNQIKRKLYVSFPGKPIPIEVSVPEKMHDFTSVMLGQGLRVKCEAEQSGRLKIFQIENREVNQPWDIFVEHYCIIDHVNRDKQLVHFIVDKKLNGIIPFAILPKNVEVGDTLAIKVSEYIVKNEVRHRVLNCNPSNRAANENVFKTFSEEIRVSNGLGFSTTDIFIDRGLINKYNIQDEDVVTGNAVLNYNKKRSQWGWKAILISM